MSTNNQKSSVMTPLARARGLGSAHHGYAHWAAQRLTAVAAVPLTIWLVYSVVRLQGADHEIFTAWLAQPFNALAMIFLVVAAFYHAALGLQVVIEDYVHCGCVKTASIVAVKFGLLALAAASVFSILAVAL